MHLDMSQVVGTMLFVLLSIPRDPFVCLEIFAGVVGGIADGYVQELKKRHGHHLLVRR